MVRKRFVGKAAATVLSVMMILNLAGCGKTPSGENNEGEQTQATEDSESAGAASKEASKGGEEVASDSEASSEVSPSEYADGTDDIVGDWVFAYSVSTSDYTDGEGYKYVTVGSDPDSPSAELIIEKKDDKYLASYKYDFYEQSLRYYGNELVYKNEAPYADCDYSNWCFEFSNPFKDDEREVKRITKAEDGTIVLCTEYTEDTTDYYYHNVTQNYFVKADSEKLQNLDDFRYFDTVTVDNTEDFLNSIKDYTKIILKAGTYNFSEVDFRNINNGFVNINGGQVQVNDVTNFKIETDGGEVLLCTNDSYSAVLSFNGGSYITLDGLTMGHNVEPGYCSGSVLYMGSVSTVKINNCKLYGSGTYGIQGDNIYDMQVTGTDIYECTYGLVDFTNSGSVNFTDCTLRDSKDMAMINAWSTYGVNFENCSFTNNEVTTGYDNYFVCSDEDSSVSFSNCTFKGNSYAEFSKYPVTMDGCNFDDEGKIDGNSISEAQITSGDDIIALYDKALERQNVIDSKINGDENNTPDQLTLNNLASEEYNLWDALLNKVWNYLPSVLDESEMEALKSEQSAWISQKENAVKDASAPWTGGSMESMIANGTAADWTRKRVEYLLDKYVRQ